jgi:hypothetical protein
LLFGSERVELRARLSTALDGEFAGLMPEAFFQ